MAAGKLTSRFGDGNSSDGGSWDRGPFGAATAGFSPGPRFCCFRRHHTCLLLAPSSYPVRVLTGCPGLVPHRCPLLAPPDCPLLVPSACPLPRPLFGELLSPLRLESSGCVFQGRLYKLVVCFIDSQSDIGDTKFAPKMAVDEKLARTNAKRALTRRQVNHIKQSLAENEIDSF